MSMSSACWRGAIARFLRSHSCVHEVNKRAHMTCLCVARFPPSVHDGTPCYYLSAAHSGFRSKHIPPMLVNCWASVADAGPTRYPALPHPCFRFGSHPVALHITTWCVHGVVKPEAAIKWTLSGTEHRPITVAVITHHR